MKLIITAFILIASFVASSQTYIPADDKSNVDFVIKNFGINTNGSFKGLKGNIIFNASDVSKSSFSVSIDANTINTGIAMRDKDLKKEEYFNTDKFPNINFQSTQITKTDKGYAVTGKLTIKDVTKTVSIPFAVETQNNGLLFTGSFSINRSDYNVGSNSAVLSSTVNINLKVFAAKQ